ncbi:hypothetical protein [Mesotoga prima]|uniref:hypothetical protein n=1 Tax=Mesotoga prima TaxID=1184387 RepID=UPI002FDA8A66
MKNDQKQPKAVVEDFAEEVISFFKGISGVKESTPLNSTSLESTSIEVTPPDSTGLEPTPADSTTKESTPPETKEVISTPADSIPLETTTPKSTPLETLTPKESTTPETTIDRETTVPDSMVVRKTAPPEFNELDIQVPKSTVLELFQQVRDYIFRTQEIGTTSKLIMLYLFDKSLVSHYISEISYTSVADAIGVSETTAIKNTKELEDKGFIRYVRGVNHKSPSKVDIRPLIEKAAVENELYIRVTDIISDWWNEIYSTRNCGGSALVMYGLYVLKYINKHYKQSGRSPSDSTTIDTGVPDSTTVDSIGVDSTSQDSNVVGYKFRFSVYATLEKILRYSFARGFDRKNISRHFFEWFAENTSMEGSYSERQKALEEFEMDILVAVEYTVSKTAKNKWNYLLSCLKNDFASKEDTPDLRNKIKQNIDLLWRYFKTPEKVFIDGAEELREIMQILGQNEEINPLTVNHTREKIKRIIEHLNASFEETIKEFNITSGKTTDDLFNIG